MNELADFRNFLYLAWDHLGLPAPTRIQYDIAEYLQNGPKRRVIEAFRGVGKSWITSAYVCHQLLLNPDSNILVVSASKQRSDDFSTFTLRMINEMPLLGHLKPTEDQRNSKVAFDVGPAKASHAPSVVSKGITSQITGSRADLIVADDVESLNNSATQTMRDKLTETMKEFDAVLKPGGHIVVLGTPQTESSIYTYMPERGFEVRIWPARYPSSSQRKGYGDKLAPALITELDTDPDISGKPTDPDRFDHEDLLEREASYGRTGFNLQFMLDSSLSDQGRYPLKLGDLIVMSINSSQGPEKPVWGASKENVIQDLPNVGLPGDRYYGPITVIDGAWADYTGSVMAIDPSGRGADETAYAVVKMLNGNLYVTNAGGLPGGYSEETLEALCQIAKKEKVNMLRIEANFGDGMFTQLLKPVLKKIYPCSIEEVKHTTQKEKRIIDTLEPVMSAHKLIFDRKVIQHDYDSTRSMPPEKALRYQLMYQMSRVTKHRGSLAHDDRLDVLAMAVSYWTEQMAQDAEQSMKQRKDKAMNDALENFMQHAVGRKPKPISWI